MEIVAMMIYRSVSRYLDCAVLQLQLPAFIRRLLTSNSSNLYTLQPPQTHLGYSQNYGRHLLQIILRHLMFRGTKMAGNYPHSHPHALFLNLKPATLTSYLKSTQATQGMEPVRRRFSTRALTKLAHQGVKMTCTF